MAFIWEKVKNLLKNISLKNRLNCISRSYGFSSASKKFTLQIGDGRAIKLETGYL
jgi:hypothetical protein